MVQVNDRGGARVTTGPLPLTYAALEVKLTNGNGRLVSFGRISALNAKRLTLAADGWRRESGWPQLPGPISAHRRMHVNSGMHQEVSGYSDTDLFEQYPLKYMNRLQPFSRYDTDAYYLVFMLWSFWESRSMAAEGLCLRRKYGKSWLLRLDTNAHIGDP